MLLSLKNARTFFQLFSAFTLSFSAHALSAPKVLYVGDSIAVETSDTVAWWSKNYSNADTTRSMFGGRAICDFTVNPNGETTLRQRVK